MVLLPVQTEQFGVSTLLRSLYPFSTGQTPPFSQRLKLTGPFEYVQHTMLSAQRNNTALHPIIGSSISPQFSVLCVKLWCKCVMWMIVGSGGRNIYRMGCTSCFLSEEHRTSSAMGMSLSIVFQRYRVSVYDYEYHCGSEQHFVRMSCCADQCH